MFQVGENVVYGAHGVCLIAASEIRRIDRKNMTYLVLEPADKSASKFYVPVHNEAAMSKLHCVLSAQELTALLESREVRSNIWVPEEGRRKQLYRDLLNGCERTAIMNMLYCIYRHRDEQVAAGKKFHVCDENFLRDAEKILISEVSVSMAIPAEQARDYIRCKLKN